MAEDPPLWKFSATLDTAVEGFTRDEITGLRYHRVLVNNTPQNRQRRQQLDDALLLAQDHNGFTRMWFACFACCQLMPDTYFSYAATQSTGPMEKSRQCYDASVQLSERLRDE